MTGTDSQAGYSGWYTAATTGPSTVAASSEWVNFTSPSTTEISKEVWATYKSDPRQAIRAIPHEPQTFDSAYMTWRAARDKLDRQKARAAKKSGVRRVKMKNSYTFGDLDRIDGYIAHVHWDSQDVNKVVDVDEIEFTDNQEA